MTVVINMHKPYFIFKTWLCHVMVMKVSCQSYACHSSKVLPTKLLNILVEITVYSILITALISQLFHSSTVIVAHLTFGFCLAFNNNIDLPALTP